MGKRHAWTSEQDDFLMDYYPAHGSRETLTEFGKRFNISLRYRQLTSRCLKLRIKLSPEKAKETRVECGKRYCQKERRDIGFVNIENGMIKTVNGWMRLGAIINVPKGYYAVHLDSDLQNNSKSNLMIIDYATNMRMTKNRFWSENPEITKAGILCCELEGMIK